MSMLFSRITVKGLTFRNRVVMPPMVTGKADAQGCVTEALIEHYQARAAAGTGTIIVEATAVDAGGQVWRGGLGAFSDDHLPGLTRLASAIKAEGAVAAIQLVHGGPQSSVEVAGQRVGPSAVAPPDGGRVPRALTGEEITAIEEQFARAARRAAEAGFEVAELHGAHNFLLDSFLSSRFNVRRDEYGGRVENRMRMLVETCRRTRQLLPAGALLCARVSMFNKPPESFTADDFRTLARALAEAGLDLLHLSTDGAFKPCFGTSKPLGRWAKESVELPVIVAGGLGDPKEAERAIATGLADFAAVGSALMEDAEWTRHAREALG